MMFIITMITCYAHVLLTLLGVTVAQNTCNGRAEYCNRRYSDVSLIGAHDSPFVGILPVDNQDLSVTGQLDFGIRFLQGQTHLDSDGSLNLCHTKCSLRDAGTLITFLQTIKSWMDNNPNEVITLLITNGDNLAISKFDQAVESSGIKPYAFVPSSSPSVLSIDSWPTLQTLIHSGNRLVVFLGENVLQLVYICTYVVSSVIWQSISDF
jgi:hypothetical protein